MYPVVSWKGYKPNCGEDLRSGVHLYAITSSHHDNTNHPKHNRQRQSLRTSPGVENLGERKLGESTDDARHNAHGGREGVFLERTCYERVQSAEDYFLC